MIRLIGSAAIALTLVTHAAWAQTSPVPVPAPAATSATATAAAPATGDAAPQIRTAVEGWLQGRYKVDGVRKTPMPGLWEVQIGMDIIYVDDKAQYGFVEGQLIEFKTNRNLTQERNEELSAVPFKDLPLALAIKQVNGKGTRKLAVFEDPNCGYCRNLRRDLISLPDVTLYTFTLPILSADSKTKVAQAWCATDRSKAWNDLMISGKVPDNKGTCETPIDKLTELARKLRVTATPTMFFGNGKRQTGGVAPDKLKKLLEDNSKES
jgi:thiol:disulfide interchange protein DsbC